MSRTKCPCIFELSCELSRRVQRPRHNLFVSDRVVGRAKHCGPKWLSATIRRVNFYDATRLPREAPTFSTLETLNKTRLVAEPQGREPASLGWREALLLRLNFAQLQFPRGVHKYQLFPYLGAAGFSKENPRRVSV